MYKPNLFDLKRIVTLKFDAVEIATSCDSCTKEDFVSYLSNAIEFFSSNLHEERNQYFFSEYQKIYKLYLDNLNKG